MITKSKLRGLHDLLVQYKRQLEERHAVKPLKSPPFFLLNYVTNELYLASLPEKRKSNVRHH